MNERTDGPLLAHRRVVGHGRRPDRWVFFLHGFFGAGRNWASIARGLVRCRPDWGAVLVDLRLHGASLDLPPPHTIAACARDVAALATHVAPTETALLGHSFGGKVALATIDDAGPPLRQVWVIDSTPTARRTEAGARDLIRQLAGLPGPWASRGEAVEQLVDRGLDRAVAEWMAANLARGADGYRWRFDLDEMDELLEDFFRADLWHVVEEPPPGLEILFVRAQIGTILSDDAAARLERLRASGAEVHLLSLAGGHWLNMENPQGLLGLLRARLPRP